MGECYRMEHIEFEAPLLQSVRYSVILTMETSNKRNEYMNQLNTYQPTQFVIILHNKGYKCCKKPRWVKSRYMDLLHAHLKVNEIVPSNENVLILEDDFEFTSHFVEHAPKIDKLLRTTNVDIYSLGGFSAVNVPFSRNDNIRTFMMGSSHAWIFTPSGRKKKFLKAYSSDVGFEGTMSKDMNAYIASKACAVQKHPYNDSFWAKNGVQYILRVFQTEKTGTTIYNAAHFAMKVGGIVPFVLVVVVVLTTTIHSILCNRGQSPL